MVGVTSSILVAPTIETPGETWGFRPLWPVRILGSWERGGATGEQSGAFDIGQRKLSACRRQVGLSKINSFEQQGLTGHFGQCIGEAIAKIELCRMTASFAEIPIGFPCNPRLGFRNRLDDEASFPDEIVETPAGDRVAATVNDHGDI